MILPEAPVWLRWGQFVDLALVFGAPFTALAWGERHAGGLWRAVLGAACVLGLACSALWFLATLAAMAACRIGDLDPVLIRTMLTASAMGWSVILRLAALTGVLALVSWQKALLPVVVPASIAVATLAWGGHAAASQGVAAALRLGGDCAHLWAALGWLGALLLLAGRLWQARAEEPVDLLAHRLRAFALIGSGLVVVIAVSGVANLLFLAPVDRWGALARQPYAHWMIAKLAMATMMLGLAALNRLRLVPALAQAQGQAARRRALIALRYSISAELLLALGVAGCVALAGTLDPGV